jgi:hypothetical protein
VPMNGTWGRRGATSVHLKNAKKEIIAKAIEAAWRNISPKGRKSLNHQGR